MTTVPLYRDEAVVLRTHKLGEADRIVTMLSKEHGQIRAVAKGVRKTSSKFGARLEPFMIADVQCYQGRTLDTVNQAEILGAYGAPISADFAAFEAAHVMVETAERLTREGVARTQYVLLVGALRSLATHEYPADLVRNAYLLRAIGLAGWAPSFAECTRCQAPGPHTALAIDLGGVVCDTCAPAGTPRVAAETITLLGALLSGEWMVATEASERARTQAHGFSAAYTQWHLEHSLKSLSISHSAELRLPAEPEAGPAR